LRPKYVAQKERHIPITTTMREYQERILSKMGDQDIELVDKYSPIYPERIDKERTKANVALLRSANRPRGFYELFLSRHIITTLILRLAEIIFRDQHWPETDTTPYCIPM
jgi:hypothetical protein